MKLLKKVFCLLLALSFALSLSACSANSSDSSDKNKIIISLDYTPNTNHTGLYVALAKGYYSEEGLDVKIVQPPEDDAISACSAGQVQFAIGFQDLLASAFASDTPMQVTAVATLLQHNTGCVMSKKGGGMERPKGLEGKEFLTWESPIELAMMKSVVTADGGNWSKVKLVPNTITDEAQDINYNPSHAIWVYYGWGGINARVNNIETDTFYFKDLNPVFDYYSPIIVVNNDYMKQQPEAVRAFLKATKKGYEYAIDNPEESAQLLIDGDDMGSLIGCEKMVTESQKWISEQYVADAEKWGYISPERWNAFYKWLNDEGLVNKPLEMDSYFTNEFLE